MIPLYKPYMPQELPELDAILHSGALSYGKWGHLFEEKLSLFLGVNYLLTTNSYASAIQIALAALDLQQGDEVITSPMSCLASNMPLLTFGLKVVWADIDPTTGTLSPDSVREKISSRTRLIFHNHFCGYVGYVDEINAIGREYGIPVIDDCVEAFGSKYKGNYTGNLGTDISIYSFQTVRLPNTIDGGAVVFKDKELYNKALLMRDFGIRRQIFRDDIGEISSACDIYMKGYGATMSEINSYIGCCAMENIVNLLICQTRNGHYWEQRLFDVQCQLMGREDVEPNYWVYGLLSNNKRIDLSHFREMGYYASGVHLPNNCYSVFGKQLSLSGVENFYSRFIALPCGWWLDDEDFIKD
ncbi:DegT/DnrJ/EryC1/StrS family aminotransferase [Bacteroides fluxus]|uniref:DegT/DnrJ/EryC1/StrS aminotransferase family protein n=1 Tax=Bacteroides fluxus YIT 12057 TaxID=763034 RepID=F3PP26_9BACE|nr:aminotransferase class V-fold PLP-dependent enzyme [Bacteroides fluxus]EGF59394.1 DegT/DnrJ/EryC1/StrS aminotransferase family protein [Bacteroides fluxus YIT 12057]